MKCCLLPLLGLSLLLAGCSKIPSDATIHRQIVGVWTFNQDGALTIASDGGWSITEWERKGSNSFAGTWQITNGVLCLTTTDSRIKSMVGKTDRYKITHLDDKTLIYGASQSPEDQITRKRIH
jgi:hypothetical protein